MPRNRVRLALLLGITLSGCATYVTPGPRADFRTMGIEPARDQTDASIAERLARRPQATFPATIAVARVQGSGYSDRRGYRNTSKQASFEVVTAREVEKESDFASIQKLPMIRAVVPLNRLVIPETPESERDLRLAAAGVQAELLLLYTFDTSIGVEHKVPVLTQVTLGHFPSDEARVTSTVSAALLDTRNGYVYGLAESTSQQAEFTNVWWTDEAIRRARERAERAAFESMLGEFEKLWKGVVEAYATAPASSPPTFGTQP